jgi:hypothetical protein
MLLANQLGGKPRRIFDFRILIFDWGARSFRKPNANPGRGAVGRAGPLRAALLQVSGAQRTGAPYLASMKNIPTSGFSYPRGDPQSKIKSQKSKI